ncbi:MAG: hypothetical protein FalmKO_45030 [Falsiruegeria mediterranea]
MREDSFGIAVREEIIDRFVLSEDRNQFSQKIHKQPDPCRVSQITMEKKPDVSVR